MTGRTESPGPQAPRHRHSRHCRRVDPRRLWRWQCLRLGLLHDAIGGPGRRRRHRPDEQGREGLPRARVIKATDAWLKTLSAPQRKTATYSYSDTAHKRQWSNFPAFFKPRTGVAYKDMSAAASQAGVAMAKAVLSKQGFKQYGDIRKADDYQAATDSGGGPGSSPDTNTPLATAPNVATPASTNGNFGEGNYYTSVFGTPSMTKPFMVSFNGHHMSFNVTFNAARLANTPEFAGVEPTRFRLDNAYYQPMKPESDAIFELLPKLPAKAKLSQTYDDVLVGPQKDGQFPKTHSGVNVSSLPSAQRALVTKLIQAYVGDVPAVISKPLIATYKKQYSRTYVAYAGSTKDQPQTYIRLDGPQVWIELAVQSSDKGSSHYHSVYRDKLHDYGA
jgi:hypothetical protein